MGEAAKKIEQTGELNIQDTSLSKTAAPLSIWKIFDRGFFSLVLIALCCLVLWVQIKSPLTGSHPDEETHIWAVQYYTTNWLPPIVDSPEIRRSRTIYGYSYLDERDIIYLFAGKHAALLSFFVENELLLHRLFNFSLIAIIVASTILLGAPNALLSCLVAAQTWYIFSYFNGDCFPFIVSFFLSCLAH